MTVDMTIRVQIDLDDAGVGDPAAGDPWEQRMLNAAQEAVSNALSFIEQNAGYEHDLATLASVGLSACRTAAEWRSQRDTESSQEASGGRPCGRNPGGSVWWGVSLEHRGPPLALRACPCWPGYRVPAADPEGQDRAQWSFGQMATTRCCSARHRRASVRGSTSGTRIRSRRTVHATPTGVVRRKNDESRSRSHGSGESPGDRAGNGEVALPLAR